MRPNVKAFIATRKLRGVNQFFNQIWYRADLILSGDGFDFSDICQLHAVYKIINQPYFGDINGHQ